MAATLNGSYRHGGDDYYGSAASTTGTMSRPPREQDLPWEEQIVPALRKKLETESAILLKRKSRIEPSDGCQSAWPPLGGPSGLTASAAVPPLGTSKSKPAAPRVSQPVRIEDAAVTDGYRPENSTNGGVNAQGNKQEGASELQGRQLCTPSPTRESARLRTKSASTSRASPQVKRALEEARRRQREQQEREFARVQATSKSRDAHEEAGDERVGQQQKLGMTNSSSSPEILSNGNLNNKHAAFEDTSLSLSQSIALNASAKRKLARSRPTADELEEFGPLGGVRQPSGAGEEAYLARSQTKGSRIRAVTLANELLSRSEASAEDVPTSSRPRPMGTTGLENATIFPDGGGHNQWRANYVKGGLSNSHSQGSMLQLSPHAAPSGGRRIASESRAAETNDFLPLSTSANPWDEELIPTVAKRLRQQRLLDGDPRLSRVEGLIDTWDRDGLPLNLSAMEASRKVQAQEQDQTIGREQAKVQVDTEGDRESNDRKERGGVEREQQRQDQSAVAGQTSTKLHAQPSGGEDSIPMHSFTSGQTTQRTHQPVPHTTTPLINTTTSPASHPHKRPDSRWQHDDDGAGCCKCTIM
ncbi:hypothetical protein K437DRAFT_259839 [Tilletiaria anomala UBC 951]|uniref:Uncharacterized protein n=1 Tax=Tilletiaria anomala (strain ATCC 24038 / CBS 436.72 / UBC 951) TaxID=1037660 RepID=A0A066V693_TILAU|nr:uncharacterized protein K437DRAFT_259839 [Tilletiaria anomala UBC 951]KDN37267.1 hypothetical protein K437DRAFT_259839 [Tilletiaria anomala UBC 951]